MELRKELEPQWEVAEKLYPEVLQLILDYTDYCDENGDEDNEEYTRLEEKLHALTGKDISRYNLWEWWEEEGAEVLAFKISLPDPTSVSEVTIGELTEIVRRIKTFEEPKGEEDENQDLKTMFTMHTTFPGGFHDEFLKINYKSYSPKLFQRLKDKDGKYFEYTIEEVVEKLLNKK